MSSPKPPAAPDPVATANAQGAMNRETAITQYNLNATNQNTPFGNLTYNQIGTWADGTPRYEANQSMSPELQATYQNLIGSANRLSGNLQNSVGTQFDTSKLPAQSGAISAPSATQTQTNAGWQGPGAQYDIAESGAPRQTIDNAGTITRNIAGAGNIQREVANSGAIRNGFSAGGSIQTGIANAGEVNRGIANAGGITGQIANAGDVQRDVGANDWSQDRQRVEEALYSRLNPQFEQDRQRQEADLVARGVRPGTAAYDRAMDSLNRSQTDARFQAVLAGGQEQSRMAGLDLAQGNFRNSAQAQQYAQNANSAAFANAAQAQRYGQNANDAAFQNAAQQQVYGQNANNAAFANSAQAQQFNQNRDLAAFGNAAQAQRYGQNANNLTLNNAAQAQQYAQNANNATFQNAAQAQQYGQNANDATFRNNAQNQQFAQNAARLEAFNAGQQQNFNNQMAMEQFNREGTLANAQLQNQNFNQQLAAGQFNNGNRQQALQESAFLRSLPMNEINALLSGTQIANPQFTNTPTPGVAGVDYAGLVQQNYANQMQGYQQQQSNRNGLFSGLAGIGTSLFRLSDYRSKVDIKRIGQTDGGLPIYTYRYANSDQVEVGVMAQDVAKVRPDAVAVMPDGYIGVDYSKIGEAA